MDESRVKRLAIISLFLDESLFDRFTLKGGNAVDLIYQATPRASRDIDISMPDAFASSELEDVKMRLQRSIVTTFELEGVRAFDFRFEKKPEVLSDDLADFWGGYRLTYKLIDDSEFRDEKMDLDTARRRSISVGGRGTVQIEFSSHEYCENRTEVELENFKINVYTPTMLACEKVRAICQQTEEYRRIVKSHQPVSRARDFVDVYQLCSIRGVDFSEPSTGLLLERCFEAKRVPMKLIRTIPEAREFHRDSFHAVEDTVRNRDDLLPYDEYFDGVIERLRRGSFL